LKTYLASTREAIGCSGGFLFLENNMTAQALEESPAVPVVSNGLYLLDAPEIVVEVPWRSDDNIVAVKMRKPIEEDYIEHEKDIKRETVVSGGWEQDNTDATQANTELFDRLVLSAEGIRKFSDKAPRPFTKDECLRFTFETKSRVINSMTQSQFETLADDDFAGLFEQDDNLIVRQTVGDPDHPQFTVDYTLAPLSRAQRQDYLTAVQQKRKPDKRRTVFKTDVTLIRKGMKLFAANLRGVSGGSIKAGPYSDETRADYVKQVDPLVQMLVIDKLYGYYQGASRV
jgi:hypothetical protein